MNIPERIKILEDEKIRLQELPNQTLQLREVSLKILQLKGLHNATNSIGKICKVDLSGGRCTFGWVYGYNVVESLYELLLSPVEKKYNIADDEVIGRKITEVKFSGEPIIHNR